jgi:pSer/pThr/pTyr-binding forkhead associated (FHA) protein
MKLTFHTPDQGILDFEIMKSSILIGRRSSCDIVIKTEGISRQHCRIDTNSKGEMFITDLASTNGVHIDGERIPVNTPTPYATYLSLGIGSISKVVLVPRVAPREEKVVLSSSSAPAMKITLDLPRDKTRNINRRGKNKSPEVEVTTSRDLPKPIIIAVGLVVLGVTLYFFMG